MMSLRRLGMDWIHLPSLRGPVPWNLQKTIQSLKNRAPKWYRPWLYFKAVQYRSSSCTSHRQYPEFPFSAKSTQAFTSELDSFVHPWERIRIPDADGRLHWWLRQMHSAPLGSNTNSTPHSPWAGSTSWIHDIILILSRVNKQAHGTDREGATVWVTPPES